MRISTELFQQLLDIEENKVLSLVIEKQDVMLAFIKEVYNAINDSDTTIVFSEDDKIIKASKKVELITSFVPFELNEKRLLTKINAMLEEEAMSEVNYEKTMQAVANIERYLTELVESVPYNLECGEMGVGNLIKAANICIRDDSETEIEKVFNYMNAVTDLLGDRLFVFVNMGSFFDESEMITFIKSVTAHKYKTMFIDNREYDFKNENVERLIIDKDLCII